MYLMVPIEQSATNFDFQIKYILVLSISGHEHIDLKSYAFHITKTNSKQITQANLLCKKFLCF